MQSDGNDDGADIEWLVTWASHRGEHTDCASASIFAPPHTDRGDDHCHSRARRQYLMVRECLQCAPPSQLFQNGRKLARA